MREYKAREKRRNIWRSMPPFTVKVLYWLMTVPYTAYTVPLYYVLQMNTHTNLNTQGYNILMGHHKRTLNLGNNVMFFFFWRER